jgi:hypothetical protein
MSTKGTQLTTQTKQAISQAKTKITREHLLESANIYLERLASDNTELPTLQGYCLEANIHPTNIQDYALKYPEVNQVINKITMLQEQYLLTRGITSKANPVFSIFLLKSKHNYLDTPQQLTQNNTFNISPDLLADALQIMNKPGKDKPSK